MLQKQKIERAQIARGGVLRWFGLLVRAKYFLSLVLGVLLGTFRRADELALAMEARAYARGERTSAVELKIRQVQTVQVVKQNVLISKIPPNSTIIKISHPGYT